ncbi:Pycsar system effector family protein [Mucilaginibacter ginkgonis]|uniref:HD domain-containing protein n=1 Tax=Mucilaginibacter ginkgonis TaxID=2682091 RepID=A0A6I4I5M2_9SPHI|nr:Pycsar system effector family protein [Mucilaginibacter ginkgonis]QQL49078.1 HD domain-containing protein [Mucilaginibacter ginkgonis]
MDYTALLKNVQQFVTTYFATHHDDRFSYHNSGHTLDVVKAATSIADHYQLSDEDRFIVLCAAWFHDIAHQNDDPAEHEAKGALMAMDYLKGLNVDEPVAEKVRGCIMATQMPQNPQNLLENIICDADLYHLGTTDFKEKSKELRKELQRVYNKDISKQDWRKGTICLMEQHRYHTDYCRLLLNDQKEKNLEELKAKLNEKDEEDTNQMSKDNKPEKVTLLPPAPGENKKDAKKRKKEKPVKGRETMFRVTSSNHQRLSDMADRKAHIMISVNAIVISLLLSLMLRRLDEHPRQTIPAIALLLVSLVTIIFSILATRPNLPGGTFTQEDIDRKQVNLLFFGNFYKMSLDQYNHGMVAMMNDSDFLYGSLIRDLYTQGTVLGRKYQLLRISYSVFMYGLIASVLMFIISAVI